MEEYTNEDTLVLKEFFKERLKSIEELNETEEILHIKKFFEESLEIIKKLNIEAYDLNRIISNKEITKSQKQVKLNDLLKEIKIIENKITETEEYKLILEEIKKERFDVETYKEELQNEKNKLKEEIKIYKERNEFLNITKEELVSKINNEIAKVKSEKELEIQKKINDLELEYSEKLFRITEEKNQEKIKIDIQFKNQIEDFMNENLKKLNEIKEEKNKLLEKEKIKIENLKNGINYLGFDEFVNEIEHIHFRNKIEAYNVLVKVKNKNKLPIIFMKEIDFATLYRHIVSTINLLIQQHNTIVDLKREVLIFKNKVQI